MSRRIATRHARRIRRGILAAHMVYDLWEAGARDRAVRTFYVAHQFGRLTRKALYREYARLVTRSVP